MAMNLVLPLPTLINQSQLEQRPHVGPLARQRDENRDVRRIVLRILPVRVEVYGPLVPSHREILARDVLTDPHAFSEGVALDDEAVRSVYRLGYGPGRGRRAYREVVLLGFRHWVVTARLQHER